MENPMVMDSLWHDWLSEGDKPDAWEQDIRDWTDIRDAVETLYSTKDIAGLVRDELDGDGDLMVDIEQAGLLDRWIAPEDRWKLKDPDTEWEVVDAVFEEQWENDALMLSLWEYDPLCERVCTRMKKAGDLDPYDYFRSKYNDWRRMQ